MAVSAYISSLEVQELIDTQWDVNVYSPIERLSRLCELIDTQWDVNNFLNRSFGGKNWELIDTQWDVNEDVYMLVQKEIPN